MLNKYDLIQPTWISFDCMGKRVISQQRKLSKEGQLTMECIPSENTFFMPLLYNCLYIPAGLLGQRKRGRTF